MKKQIEKIVKHADVSEKAIERYLCDLVSKMGGQCLKYSNPNMVGYPDRVVLMPAGATVWVELKSKGCSLKKIQEIRKEQLERIGQKVLVVDSKLKAIKAVHEATLYAILHTQYKPDLLKLQKINNMLIDLAYAEQSAEEMEAEK